MDARLKAALVFSLLLAVPAVPALAQVHAYGGEQFAYVTLIAEKKAQIENDSVDLLQGLIADAVPDSAAERKLIYRLAAVYYRQLRTAEAQAVLASLDTTKSGPRTMATGAMSALVLNQDLAGATGVGEAAVPRYKEERDMAALADEILGSALASSEPGSASHESILGRRVATMARLAAATVNLARLHSAIGEVYHARKQLPQAEQHYRAALALFGKQQGSDPASLINTRSGLAILLRTRGNAAAALPLQEAALAEMKNSYPPNHPDRLESERELAQLKLALRMGPGRSGSAAKGAKRPAAR